MQASEVIAVLNVLDGTIEDLDRIRAIERLYREINPSEGKESQEL